MDEDAALVCTPNVPPQIGLRRLTPRQQSVLIAQSPWRRLAKHPSDRKGMIPMKRIVSVTLISCALASPLYAALKVGATAPDFTTEATLAGKPFTFSLAAALMKGPVVLYFYPAAFTPGCTVEAHEFAQATAKFAALGATVIGVSHDPISKLNKFSVTECRNKFPVASDADQHIMKAYDAVLLLDPKYANRTSYVIAPDGKIIYEYTAMNPNKHVANTMAAVAKWDAAHRPKG